VVAYGQTDQIIELNKGLKEAIDLLVAVATEEKGVSDVRSWLEENYPEARIETDVRKRQRW
jgi:hypothetical protein